MKITADTNILARAVTGDNERQSRAAQAELARADAVALPIMVLWELVWVLSQGYRIGRNDIAETVRRLLNASNVSADRPAVEAGLALLDAGGDFADGVIAQAGRWLGADVFVSFDKAAVALLAAQGQAARLPA